MSETFRFMNVVWDVTKAKQIVEGREPNETLSINEKHLGPLFGGLADRRSIVKVWVNEAHAMSDEVDLTVPLIGIRLPDTVWVIDGWHRIYRALQLGIPELPMIVLSKQEDKACRL